MTTVDATISLTGGTLDLNSAPYEINLRFHPMLRQGCDRYLLIAVDG